MSTEKIRWPRVILGAIVMLVLWCLLVFAPALVMAQEDCSYTVSWDAPTQYTDGSPLGEDLDGFVLYYGETHEYELPPVDITSSQQRSIELVCPDPTKTYYAVMTAYVPCSLRQSNPECQNGETRLESAFSAEITLAPDGAPIGLPPPGPPQNLRVVSDGDLVAYAISQTEDRVTLVPVGTVPVGTPCDSDESVNGAHRVPVSSVVWAGTVRPKAAFAACEPF